MTSDLSPQWRGERRRFRFHQLSRQQTGRQDGASVDLWVAEFLASKLGLVSELFLDPTGQRSQKSVCLFWVYWSVNGLTQLC